MEKMEAQQLKLQGMLSSAKKHSADLIRAQLVARMLGLAGEQITSDDVRAEFSKHYGREMKIGNAAGSIFDKDDWECVGFVKSKRPASHSRMIRTWRLKKPYKPAPVAPEVGIENGVRFCRECGKETEACSCVTKSV